MENIQESVELSDKTKHELIEQMYLLSQKLYKRSKIYRKLTLDLDVVWALRELEQRIANHNRLVSFNIKHKLWMNS